ncbi:glycosyltransferase family 2 protein [Methyloterricola oryzae]|uniref:glycosyltransferase family 2 protein n=1 Tax=Methyloterricola oryzae TaxID=1495050 RepID=UPI0005EB51C8|nr:glycosyltransferase family 2 protein [Methyloterricola oryzae]
MNGPRITLSIVSHGHGPLLSELLTSIARNCQSDLEVLVTENFPEGLEAPEDFPFPLRIIRNARAKGFGANQNAALKQANGDYFCVLNPDIGLSCDPFPALLACLQANPSAGVVAPRVVSPEGLLEDSARDFPSPWTIVKKALGLNRDRETLHKRLQGDALSVDWVAGMFLLFPAAVFREIGGFDEAFFLYYEDVDLCSRLHARGLEVLLAPEVSVVHDARRESHRNLMYLRWHLASMLRFFIYHFFRNLRAGSTP